ncbi:sulfur carrier protein ThiS [Actibacterium sp. XHP0104]|uniref:sulfur carrier protein ThiS n=1 Tax=Actibacterium sp. XHP0104 TaxID=2984335 RepID=UPI0021E95AED|nr:sulfur carrier protein ThiS [Actibacterium sp. XHP0104]MCV2880414.1 sulfur carrier protein ThiS [Actibacterium sp. XHP0104]
MQIDLNGAQVITQARTLAALIDEQGFAAEVVATAVRGEFVPRSARADTPLAPGDRVEVLSPMQGG